MLKFSTISRFDIQNLPTEQQVPCRSAKRTDLTLYGRLVHKSINNGCDSHVIKPASHLASWHIASRESLLPSGCTSCYRTCKMSCEGWSLVSLLVFRWPQWQQLVATRAPAAADPWCSGNPRSEMIFFSKSMMTNVET